MLHLLLLLPLAASAQEGQSILRQLGGMEDFGARSDRAREAREQAGAAMERDEFERALALYLESLEGSFFGPFGGHCDVARAAEAVGDEPLAREHWGECAESALSGGVMVGSMFDDEPSGPSRQERRLEALHDLIRLRSAGREALDSGDHAMASSAFVEAYDLDPNCPGQACPPWSLRAAARAAAGAGDFDRARRFYDRYLRARPEAYDLEAVTAEVAALDEAEAQSETAWAARSLRVGAGWGAPPAWLEPISDAPRPSFASFDSVSRFAVGRYEPAAAWYGLQDGLVGPLAIAGDAHWVGLAESGVVYVQAEDGALSRAPSLRQAVDPGAFESLGSFPALWWDAAGETLVGVGEEAIWVSNDAGATIRKRDLVATTAFARADGVAVVQTFDGLLSVTRDGGLTWQETRGLGQATLERTGSFIGFVRSQDYDYSGGIYGGPQMRWVCEEAVLARDGQTWVAWGEGPAGDDEGPWPLDLYAVPGAGQWDRDLLPSAPSAENEPASDAVARCQEDPEAYHGGFGGVGGIAMGGRRAFDLVRHPKRRAGTSVRFLGDARCTERKCKAKDRASLVLASPEGIRVIEPPKGCIPHTVHALGGPSALRCWSDDVVLLDAKGVAVESFRWEKPARDWGVYPDGTLVIAGWDGAWVRRPLPLGSEEAWRWVSVENTRAYRAAPGGAVLALTSEVSGYQRREPGMSFDLWLDDGELTPLAQGLELPEGSIVDVRVRDDGAILIETEDYPHGESCLVAKDGSALECRERR